MKGAEISCVIASVILSCVLLPGSDLHPLGALIHSLGVVTPSITQ